MSMVIDLVIWLIWIILAFTLLVPMFVLLVMGVLYLMDPRIGCVNRGQVCDFLCKRRHALKTPAKYTAALIIAYFVYCNSGASPIAQVKAGIVAACVESMLFVVWCWARRWPESNWNNAVGCACLAGLWCIMYMSTLIVEATPLYA